MTKILARLILTGEVPPDCLVGHWHKPAVGTGGAFDLGLVTDAADPLVPARRHVAGLAGPAALEPAGINVVPAPEQRLEQRDLGTEWRFTAAVCSL